MVFKRQNTAGALFGNTPQTEVSFAAPCLQLPLTAMAICLRRTSLVWVLVVTCGCATPASPTEAAPGGGDGAMASSIVDLTNAERANAGIAPFRTSAQLMQAAQLQADQMARLGRMEHELPGAQYPTPADRLAAVGYRWSTYGENIAMGQSSAAAVVDAWMHSSGHRANILNSAFREIGAGYARDSAGRPYYVQVFGTPR